MDSGDDDARARYAVRLAQLLAVSGLTQARAANRAMTTRPTGQSWKITAQRISSWKRGVELPEQGSAAWLVRTLIMAARDRGVRVGDVEPGLLDEATWGRWWAAAKQTPKSAPRKMAGPTSVAGAAQVRYLHQVQRLAPYGGLIGRDRELAELAGFCIAADRGPYVWWQAPAWVGKTALMASFVLAPPPGVRIVSFFITARLAGQNEQAAFFASVLEQLAVVLGQSIPAVPPASIRDMYLLEMLADAAQLCQANHERLVLLVDGLDEDRGVMGGADTYSIAALLPASPPAGMRVIVSGRANPPLAVDVPPDHPLRDPAIVRTLDVSATATAVQADMERELDLLLSGGPVERQVLGLLVASGGGLSAADLAELSGIPVWDIEQRLHAVTGRSYACRPPGLGVDPSRDVYLLGHAELHQTATAVLGAHRLTGYRNRLHAWAEGYRELGWPDTTPDYLLLGYFGMLTESRDVVRIVDCAVDLARHDRMHDCSGGDVIAMTEITTAQDLILTHDEPDLTAMARLAVHREHLNDRNSNVPIRLPAVWAALGNVEKAIQLARSHPSWTARALSSVAEAVAGIGDLGRAHDLAIEAQSSRPDAMAEADIVEFLAKLAIKRGDHDEVEALVRPYSCDDGWSWINLTSLVSHMVDTGDLDHVEAFARSISHPDQRSQALAFLAAVTADQGDLDRGRELLTTAQSAANSLTVPAERCRALGYLAKQVTQTDRLGDARELVAQAEAAANSIIDPDHRIKSICWLAGKLAEAGDLDSAGRLVAGAHTAIDRLLEPDQRIDALCALATTMAEAGDLDSVRATVTQAAAAATSAADPVYQCKLLAYLAKTTAKSGDRNKARELIQLAQLTADSIYNSYSTDWESMMVSLGEAVAYAGGLEQAGRIASGGGLGGEYQAELIAAIARAAAELGDLDYAESTACEIIHDDQILEPVAKIVAEQGDLDRAARITCLISDSKKQSETLALLADLAIQAGDRDRARRLAVRSETLARSIPHCYWKDEVPAALAKAFATTGDLDRAEELTQSISDPGQRCHTWVRLATIAAKQADPDRALQFITQAETSVHRFFDPYWNGVELSTLAKAAAMTGDSSRARDLLIDAESHAHNIADVYHRSRVLTFLAQTSAQIGNLRRARLLASAAHTAARSVSEPHLRSRLLAALVNVLSETGNPQRARDAAADAQRLVRAVSEANLQGPTLVSVVRAMTETSTAIDRAASLAASILDPRWRSEATASVVQAVAAAGDLNRAFDLARSISDTRWQSQALVHLARSAADRGDLKRARDLAMNAEDRVRSISDPYSYGQALAELVTLPDLVNTRRLVARILQVHHWALFLDAWAGKYPIVLTTIVDELTILNQRAYSVIETASEDEFAEPRDAW